MRQTLSISLIALTFGLSGCTTLEGVWADLKTSGASEKTTTADAPDIEELEADMLAAKAIWSEVDDQANHAGHDIKRSEPVKLTSIDPQPLKLRGRYEIEPGKPRPASVAEARAMAKVGPDGSDYLGAIQLYGFERGSIYQVYGTPEQVTDIALETGEELISVSAGDTVRWMVGDTRSGAGLNAQIHILIKPLTENISTNLIILTSKRTYYVDLVAQPDNYMPAVAWTYKTRPVPLQSRQASTPVQYASLRPASSLAYRDSPALENLNFAYKIKGDHPDWRPVRAFDDGDKVFIQFPVTIGRSEAPPLFVETDSGDSALVNYRVKGRYYVVDRLFDKAELRLGEKKQQVVKI
ncbi:MAG: P-type conjugative transfer protein TrbG, partial [Hellea sp.]|nr:P-type conjugative transfer protein TrbG [Hellea sp.]